MPQLTPDAQARASKQDRELRVMYIKPYIDAADAETTPWYRLGFDNDDLTRTIGWDTESVQNVWGITVTSNTRGDETISLDPLYMREGDPMSLLVQHLDVAKADLDDIKRPYAEAKLDREGNVIFAFIQTVDVMVQSAGGTSSNADNLPVEIVLSGARQTADYDIATEEFTPI